MKNFLSRFSSAKLFFFSFLLSGLFVFTSTETNAQTASTFDKAFSVPQGQFVDVQTAIERLDNALSSIKVVLSNMDPTSQAYRDLQAKYAYFESIKNILENGKGTDSATVANAIADGMAVSTTDAYGGTDHKKILLFKQDAIVLLKI